MTQRIHTFRFSLSFQYRFSFAVLILTVFFGCATSPPPKRISSQETVLLEFTCHIDNGDILATTVQSVANDGHSRRSTAFVPSKVYGPALIEIGRDLPQPPSGALRPLLDEITYRLASRVEGLAYGETYDLTITSENISDLPEAERYIQFSRTLQRPKRRSVSKIQYTQTTGKEPKVGDRAFIRGNFPWQVKAITKDMVVIEHFVEDGKKVRLTYGEAVIRDRGDHFDLEIDVRVGNLVRIGPYIGRICELDENVFKVDYGQPFGQKALTCQVRARQVDPDLQ